MKHRCLPLIVATLFALWLAGCAQVSHVATGEVTVQQHLTVTLDRPWNQFEDNQGNGVPTWTQQGITVDTLKFYVGLKDGALLAPTPDEPKGVAPLVYKSGMPTSEIVGLFGRLYSRDGSTFTLALVAPEAFAGGAGFRFEFGSVRKSDDVRLRGIGWGTVRDGHLYAITYTAPRLAFYPAGLPSATAIAKSARIRN